MFPISILCSARLRDIHPNVNGSPQSMTQQSKEQFGLNTTIGRAGQQVEVATCFVFLASADSSHIR